MRSATLFLPFLALSAASCATRTEERAEPPAAGETALPNVIWIVADDVGWADLPGYGDPPLAAPALARLAAEGVVFPAAYAAASVCSPARAALLAARYPQRFGHENNTGDLARQLREGIGLPLGTPTVAEALAARGYATGAVGKWHLGASAPFHPLERGFGEFFGFLGGGHPYFAWDDPETGPVLRGREPAAGEGYLTDAFTDEALAFVERHAREPFFLYLAYNALHPPLEAPAERLAAVPANVGDENRRTYAAMLAALDAGVGRILEDLARRALLERTWVVFLGDNGGEPEHGADNGPLRAGKRSPFEGGLRVPLVIRPPGAAGIAGGARYAHTVSALDVAATTLAVAGARLGEDLPPDGVDLAPLLESGAPPDREALFWRRGAARAVRRGDWKLVRRDRRGRPAQLYDLSVDPGEGRDLAEQHPEVVAELEDLLARWEEELVDPLWEWRDEED